MFDAECRSRSYSFTTPSLTSSSCSTFATTRGKIFSDTFRIEFGGKCVAVRLFRKMIKVQRRGDVICLLTCSLLISLKHEFYRKE